MEQNYLNRNSMTQSPHERKLATHVSWQNNAGNTSCINMRHFLASTFLKTKKSFALLLFICFIATNNLSAINGGGFNYDRTLRDVTWNSTEHCLEFSVLIMDDFGDGRNEWVDNAYVYINGENVFDIGGPGANERACNTDETAHPRIRWQVSSPNGKVFIRAQGVSSSANDCPPSWRNTPFTDYYIGSYGSGDYFQCSEIPGYVGDHYQYARFRWYPTEPLWGGQISVKLTSVRIIEQETGQTKYVDDFEKSTNVIMPSSPSDQSISDGTIQPGGELKFITSASGASAFTLKKNWGLETKSGSSATFTGKYIKSESEFLNGVSFGFDVQKTYGSGDKTSTFAWSSSRTVTSQRTGVFTNRLEAWLLTCGEVKLNWQIKNPNTTSVNTEAFDLQVRKNGGGWINIPNSVDYNSINGGTTTYEFTYQLPSNELNKGFVDYEFRVKRKFADWDDSSFGNVASNSNLFQRNKGMRINTNYKELANISITEGKDNYPRLRWNFTTNGIECNDNITMKLKIGDTETVIPKDSILKSNAGYQSTPSDGMIACSPQRYSLILQYGSLPAVTYLVNNNYVFQPEGKRQFEKIVASKGYYSDYNSIKWYLLKNWDEFDSFQLTRRLLSSKDTSFVTLAEFSHKRGQLLYSYDDYNINAGMYYEYRVEGLYRCDENGGSLSSPIEVGFSQPYGSLSGRITYAGSSAVKNVKVGLNTADALKGNRELEFSSSRGNSYAEVPGNSHFFSPEGFSFQTWIKLSSAKNGYILNSKNINLSLLGNAQYLQVSMTGGSKVVKSTNNVIPVGSYCHLTITAKPVSANNKSYEVSIYINGELNVSETINLSSPLAANTLSVFFGNISKGPNSAQYMFNGTMDDIRLWDKTLTAEEVSLNSDRILSGKEAGLVAYFKCDETNDINSDLFDCSSEGVSFNGNHSKKGSGVNRQDVPLSASHLSIKGITDENGIYQITNVVPYTNEGTTYIVTPEFGIHKFDPNKRPLYFSPASKVFNNVDFTDVSSFAVRGIITYSNSEYPVDSAYIYIDGSIASKDGKPVLSNTQGEFTVDVPIGNHFIEVQKQGHTFANNGRFPLDPKNIGTKYNFQEDMSGFVFTDQTTARLMGRVVGGEIQNTKPLGFGLSNANIGKAIVTLQAVNDTYKLSISPNDSTTTGVIGGKESITKFKKYSADVRNVIEIETNAETGEFLAVLPPIPYNVIGVKTADFEDGAGDLVIDFDYSKTTIKMNTIQAQKVEYTDSTNKVHSFAYHDSLKITKYNEPTITVKDKSATKGAFGDSVYIYRNFTTSTFDSIKLYTIMPNGSVQYTLNYPVFTQDKSKYAWEVSAFEEYRNTDGEDVIFDNVPLAGETINITNGLASNQVIFEYNEATGEVGEQISQTASESAITLDAEGKRNFKFNTGLPNLSGDNLLAVKLTLNKNGENFVWNNGLPDGVDFKGYLMGQVTSSGNNFITKGPDAVDIILPDPPGSYSFAFIEKGTSITASHTTSYNFEVTEEAFVDLNIGLKVKTAAGIGFEVISENGIIASLGTTLGSKQFREEGNTWSTTYNFNEQVNTSGDVAFIGSDADVYIGRSQNRIFGQVRQLALYPIADDPNDNPIDPIETGNYRLFMKEKTAVGDEFATMFSYTQGHIINSLIPNTKLLRNNLIRYYNGILPEAGTPAGQQFAESLTFVDDLGENVEVVYLSNKATADDDFGQLGTYTAYRKPGSTKPVADEVLAYNNWIASWEKTISDNEESKIALFDNRSTLEKEKMMYNRSFNSGVNISESINTEYGHMSFKEKNNVLFGSITATGGFSYNDLTGVEAGLTIGFEDTWGDIRENENTATITFGYELSEDGGDYTMGVNDAITVDIYKPIEDNMMEVINSGSLKNPINTLRGYTFRTRAGQTSCPFEPGDSTLYYAKDGKKQLLNYGTFQIEKPEIYINSSKIATAESIPAGREATFLVQMQNMSETKNAVPYQLTVGDYSNLNGLILSIDGTPLTQPREYTIEYGEQLTKTLRVKQSTLDALEYDDVELVLSSTCDDSDLTSSSATLSVSFMPSSSPVMLKANTSLVNRYQLDEKQGKVSFTISDYDRTFKDFVFIGLQQKRKGENWPIGYVREFIIDNTEHPVSESPTTRELVAGATCQYTIEFGEITPSDGEYVFRAVAVSKNNITNSSDEITIVKDVRNPELLGNASPVTGILNAGGEISITFNEDIQTGMISKNNFKITGILNESIRQEPTVGVGFDGSALAFTELPIYTSGSFTIEAWFKRPQNTEGTIFAYGEGFNFISLGFDASGHAIVTIGDETKISDNAITASEVWKHVGLAYNRAQNTVSLYIAEGSNTLTPFQSVLFSQQPAMHGKLYVGNNALGNSGFNGAVGLLHFYAEARTLNAITNSRYLTKSGNEPNLIGLWEMEEGEGLIARDKARSRHLTLNASWYIYPSGKSLAFNGTSDYAVIPSGTYPFVPYDNFTWEFWFKAENQGEATLLSVGESIHIGFNANKQLMLNVKGETQVLATANLLDNQWHHFALSVKRTGNTNAIIDGKVSTSFNSSLFSKTVDGIYCLGAKYETESGQTTYSKYFKGNIDELRVWQSALPTDALVLNKNSKLRGTEPGLLAYYPFETYSKQDQTWEVFESLNDMVTPSLEVENMLATSDLCAPMKSARPVSDVSFSVVPSDRKIVLNLLEEDYKLEGVTLTISGKEIYDMHNNSSSVITWTAYVNRNALNWQTDVIDLKIAQGEGQIFKATISNSGGTAADYQIGNLPSWITVSTLSGTLQPLASKELTFTIPKSINIGSYETSITLTGSNNVQKILPVLLRVTGKRPDWAVNPSDFEHSMTVTGQILIEEMPQEDTSDLLAAFINGKCVGLISPQYEPAYQTYFVFMNIWGDTEEMNKDISFKLWDAGTGQIYPVIETNLNSESIYMQFVADDFVGMPDNPVSFNARDVIEQAFLLNKGWNWISFNVENDKPKLLDQFKTNAQGFGIQLKANKGTFINNSGSSWGGSLSTLSNTEGYLLKTTQAATLKITGKAIEPLAVPITLSPNKWTWIGYTPQFSLPVSEALAGIANPQTGDQIKGRKGYQIRSTNGWVGSLGTMEPGLGYMYKSGNNDAVSFNYPNVPSTHKSSSILNTEEQIVEPHWISDNYRYANSMTVTASVFIDNEEMLNGPIEIAAFSGDECRGSVVMQYISGFDHPYMGFLMVHGENNDPLHFRVYDHYSKTGYVASEQISFLTDSTFGTVDNLYALSLLTGENEIDNERIQIYPNPVETNLFITHSLELLDQVEIMDISGRVLTVEKNFKLKSIDVSWLSPGSYFLRVTASGQTSVYKFIKKLQ
ncbi:MAG TPA: LamG-like jellyroll fold domain-containing protein [Prolixibacteraceae bacterium]|nr:LamG-like jellyroll fold domain-containing protein [Prolixibacteraceae bacterium]